MEAKDVAIVFLLIVLTVLLIRIHNQELLMAKSTEAAAIPDVEVAPKTIDEYIEWRLRQLGG